MNTKIYWLKKIRIVWFFNVLAFFVLTLLILPLPVSFAKQIVDNPWHEDSKS
ncbi:MAG: hypothetical protein KKD05_07410 [Candidatus Omnitrophica bacterium]|nr:hypothetical protein [Candidatus Omnitrophota bacterium]